MKKTFYVTTPIYYPSGKLHIGHVYTTTLARTLANYKELMGYEVRMLTGADEHGQKIEMKAKENNIAPQEYVDSMAEQFEDLWKRLEINYDFFSRTSNADHMNSVKQIFNDFFTDKKIFKGNYTGLYSVQDEEFLTITQAEERDGKYYHPESGHELQEVAEESYFFKMSEYTNWWKSYIEEHPDFVLPSKIINELRNNFIDKGLSDLSVTRSSFTWGIPIDQDVKHIIYVWLDALTNYITALGFKTEDDSEYKKFWENGDEIVHIVGKEITRFHGIYWPIMLEAAGLRQPTTILSHGWIVTPEGKMSKSKGNVVDPISLIDKYGAEVVKYFFATQINMGQDGVFDEEALVNVFNSELANNFGNLLSRTIAMTLQNFETPVKHVEPTQEVDKNILASIKSHADQYKVKFDKFEINKALKEAMKLGKELNLYIDLTKPWTLKDDKARLAEVLNNLLNGIYAMSTMLSVVIPNKSDEALKLIGFDQPIFEDIYNENKFDNILPIKGNVLFERIK